MKLLIMPFPLLPPLPLNKLWSPASPYATVHMRAVTAVRAISLLIVIDQVAHPHNTKDAQCNHMKHVMLQKYSNYV
jgi:hypothetical protein